MPVELYGLHGTIRAKPGQRDALLAVLLDAAKYAPRMPGCRLYVVGTIADEPDAISVTEIWDDKAAHDASLGLESVREIIGRGRPLIAGAGDSVTFTPVGGFGIPGRPPVTGERRVQAPR
jgi:quinol monooxygenase YgiN